MIMQKEFELFKLDNGKARAYDYTVKECIENGCELVIKYKDKFMTITNEQLKNTKQVNFNRYPTQYPGPGRPKFYSWIHFPWIPDKVEVTNIPTLFDDVQSSMNSI